jgi:hypothetical protein
MYRSRAWLTSLPLLLASWQATHMLAYRNAPVGHAELARWHGYMSLRLALGILGAIILVSPLVAVADAMRGRRGRPLPPWVFALLPLVAFAFQECLEARLYGGGPPWQELGHPRFLLALALQLPFAAVAYVAAGLLLRAAKRMGSALTPREPRPRLASASLSVPTFAPPFRSPLISRGPPKRGPPLPVGA